MGKFVLTEQKLYKMIVESITEVLNENTSDDLMYDIIEEYSEEDLLFEFLEDKEHGITRKQWDLIPAEQYKNLLNRYMAAPNPESARIPKNIVDNWIKLIMKNLISIDYITAFAGHEQYFPIDALENVFGNDVDWNNYSESSDYLDNIGFYDWCKFPDGSDAWSDYGIKPIYDLLKQYDYNMESSDMLLLINRILDITHCRGDLASAFIEGGSKTCSQISALSQLPTTKVVGLWSKGQNPVTD